MNIQIALTIGHLAFYTGVVLVVRLWMKRDVPSSFLILAFGTSFLALRAIGLPHFSYILPDEAELIVAAKMTLAGGMPWSTVDTATSGPLNYWVLLWPSIFGIEPSYLTAQITSVILKLSLLLLPLALEKTVSRFTAWASFLLLWGFYCFVHNVYSYHYFNVDLPVAMLCLSLWFFAKEWPLASLVVLGAVPFAKIQFAPLAAFAALLILLSRVKAPFRPRQVGSLVAATASVPVLFLTMLLFSGSWSEFWNAYILMPLHYGAKSFGISADQIQLAQIESRSSSLVVNLITNVDLRIYAIGSLLAFTVFLGFVLKRWPSLSTKERRRIGASLLFLLVACATAAFSANAATYYVFLFVVPATIFFAVAADAIKTGAILGLIAGAIVILQDGLFLKREAGPQPSPIATILSQRTEHYFPELITLVKKQTRPGEKIAVWGYAPEIFLYTSTLPAHRYVIGEFVIRNHPGTQFYRSRYLADLKANPPRFLIDATGEGAWNLNSRSAYGIENDSELLNFIQTNYELVRDFSGSTPGTGPRLFARMISQ